MNRQLSDRRGFLKSLGLGALTCLVSSKVSEGGAPARKPNIIWLSCEDISPHLGCYGDEQALTPHLDQLAGEGTRYTHAFTTAGVCAPCRSGIITGMYQTSIGTHHMRCSARLPKRIKAFSSYLRKSGYYCSNNSKTDYQTKDLKDAWDQSNGKAHWRQRAPGQPFFAVFNFTGCHESGIAGQSKYESVTRDLRPEQRQDPGKLKLPPYYPDTPVTREDWKRNYELITAMDAWAGDLIGQLKKDGLYEDTIIFFWSDHGAGLPRAKRWLYDSGTHIPLIVRIPRKYDSLQQARAGTVTDRLVSSIDLGPSVLNLAGVSIPKHMQGQPFLGRNLPQARDYVFGARDRMDERYDIIRSVRDKRYRYIRNYEPFKTYYQYMNTPEKGKTMQEIRRVHAAGQLPAPAALFMADSKPVEELYDLQNDPHEIHNLAQSPGHKAVLERMRQVQLQWARDTRDLGLIPEPVILEQEEEHGNRYDILHQGRSTDYIDQLVRQANLALQGPSALGQLLSSVKDEDPVIRYWALVGIGNTGTDALSAQGQVTDRLGDGSVCVRIAAARALCRMKKPARALPVLIAALEDENQWARLQAAIVLDSIGEMARPAEAALKRALRDQPNHNKYITRVANRALNVMNKTNNTVR